MSSRYFNFPVVETIPRRHPAHEDDRLVVKIVTSFIFMLLPTLLGVGVWAGCLLHSSKTWYDVILDSPIKLPFFIFGGVWCGIYGTLGLGVYLTWYQMGAKRGLVYILHGVTAIVLSLSYPPVLVVAHWLLPSIAIIGTLWLLLVLCIMCFSRVSVSSGVSVLPALLWTSYTLMFTFFPFYEKHFGEKSGAG